MKNELIKALCNAGLGGGISTANKCFTLIHNLVVYAPGAIKHAKKFLKQ